MQIEDFFGALATYDIVVAPSGAHAMLLAWRASHPEAPFRLVTKEALIEARYGKLSPKALPFLIAVRDLSPDLADTYLRHLAFLPEAEGTDPQVRLLQEIRQQLLAAHMLIVDPYDAMLFRRRKVAVLGYDSEDSELSSTLALFEAAADFLTLPSVSAHPPVRHFVTVEEETEWVFNEIGALYHAGVPLDRIALLNPPEEYHFMIHTLSAMYGIPVNLPESARLSETEAGIRVLKSIETGDDAAAVLAGLTKVGNDDETAIANALLPWLSEPIAPRHQWAFYRQILTAGKLPATRMNPAVACLEVPLALPETYVFILGFNEGHFPSVHQDTDFLSDATKQTLGRITSKIENATSKRALEALIRSPLHIYLSFKDQSLSERYSPSPLIQACGLAVIEAPRHEIHYSRRWAALRLAALRDQWRKYRQADIWLGALEASLTIPYQTFRHTYTPLTVRLVSGRQQYSYTAVNEFYQCQFRYYLDRIMKIDPFENNFYTKFGNLAHAVLARQFGPDFDFETAYQSAYAEAAYDARENALLGRLKEQLREVVSYNAMHYREMANPTVTSERQLSVDLSPEIRLTGKIDKVLLTGTGSPRYLTLVDYKTGNAEFHPKYLPYGQSLQLPIYALLAAHNLDYQNRQIIGLFIQNILSNKLVRPQGKSAADFLADQFRLNGVFSDDLEALKTLDPTYASSRYIKGLKVLKSGGLTAASAKRTITPETIAEYQAVAEAKIREADAKIRGLDFTINPKQFDGGDLPCVFCSYRDICYRDMNDVVKISTKEEDDAEVDA